MTPPRSSTPGRSRSRRATSVARSPAAPARAPTPMCRCPPRSASSRLATWRPTARPTGTGWLLPPSRSSVDRSPSTTTPRGHARVHEGAASQRLLWLQPQLHTANDKGTATWSIPAGNEAVAIYLKSLAAHNFVDKWQNHIGRLVEIRITMRVDLGLFRQCATGIATNTTKNDLGWNPSLNRRSARYCSNTPSASAGRIGVWYARSPSGWPGRWTWDFIGEGLVGS